MDPLTISLLSGLAGSLLGGLFGKKNNQISAEELGKLTAEDFKNLLKIPEVQDLLNLQKAQALRLEPLQQAVSQGAFQLLPLHMRQGIDFWRVPTPSVPTFPQITPAGGSAGNATTTPPLQNPSPNSNPNALSYDKPTRRLPPRYREE